MTCALENGKYAVSVADALLFDSSCGGEQLILNAKTLLNSSITQAIQSTTVYSGKGSQAGFEFNYQKEITVALEDSVFSPVYLAVQNGTNIVNELTKVYTQESVTFDASGVATLEKGIPAGNVQVATDGVYSTYLATGQILTVPTLAGQTANVVYYEESNQDKIKISASAFPKAMKLVLNIDIFDNNGKAETLQITVPNFKPDGAMELSLTHDGVATSSLNGKALKDCQGDYAEIALIPVSQTEAPCFNALVASPNTIEFDTTTGGTETISVLGVRGGLYGNITLDPSKLTWTSSDANVVSVANGVITMEATAVTGDTATVTVSDGSGLTSIIAVEIN